MRGEPFYLFFVTIMVLLISDCGYKYPIPPEPGEGIPPESSYVLVGSPWSVEGALDILRASDGRIYILYSKSIEKRYANGSLIKTFGEGELQDARRLTEGPERSLYVLDLSIGGVLQFSFEGEKIGEIVLGAIENPGGIAFGEKGIYLSDDSLNLLLHFDTLGNFLDTLSRGGNGILNVERPNGVFYDALERILVASTGHNWVEGFPPDTPIVSLLHLGGTSPEGGSEEGEFISPLDVSADLNGYVFVADSGNKRIQKFSPDGDFVVSVPVEEGYPFRVDVEPDGNTYYVLTHTGDGMKVGRYRKVPKPGGED